MSTRFSSALGIGLALVSLLAVAPAHADKRVALVVGNSAYQNIPRLANPANDAKLMADTLRSLGFVLVGGGAQLDLDEGNFRRAVQSFGTQLQGADVGLFYFAGHGVQVRGANYLVPVGANPTREADVDFQMLDTNLVLRQMEGAGTKLNLVILDACRNNPFGGRGLRAVDSGLAQMRAPEGTLISFATQPGNVAQDGAGGNSPYTNALAQTMRRPGLGIFDVFNEVGLAVMLATGDAQQPWVSTSPIRGSFFFAGPSAGGAAPVVTPGPAIDEIAWGFVRNTTDLAALRQFLSQFAASPHKAEAEARIAVLERAERERHPVEEQRRPQRPGQDDIGAQIDAMVGPPPPLPDVAAAFAPRPVRPLPPMSDDIGKRIDEMVALAPMTDAPADVRAPTIPSSPMERLAVIGNPPPGPVGRFGIRTVNGNFLTALGGGGVRAAESFHTDATATRAWEIFTLVSLGGGKYAIQTESGNYLTAVNGGGVGKDDAVHTDAKSIARWEQFALADLGGGRYAIQTATGNYLTAVRGGGVRGRGALHTDATNVQAWEQFTLKRIPD